MTSQKVNIDDLVKSRKMLFPVIFRFIGESSVFRELWLAWTPTFAGVTTFYESIIAYGSNCEMETQILLSEDLDYI